MQEDLKQVISILRETKATNVNWESLLISVDYIKDIKRLLAGINYRLEEVMKEKALHERREDVLRVDTNRVRSMLRRGSL